MQFRDFSFPAGPEKVTISHTNALAVHFCPGRGDVVQDLGARARVVRCAGCFWGETPTEALEQLEGFRRAAADSARGLLFIPGLAPLYAHLQDMAVEAKGDGRILPYTMTFVEDREGM